MKRGRILVVDDNQGIRSLTLVAKELGVSRPTLYSKLKKYNI